MVPEDKENAVEEVIEELLVDPDDAENSKTSPAPQTIENEPSPKK